MVYLLFISKIYSLFLFRTNINNKFKYYNENQIKFTINLFFILSKKTVDLLQFIEIIN